MTGIAATIASLYDSISFSAIKETVKVVSKALWDTAMSLSPFQDSLSNNSFLGAFILGYIALTIVVETMGGAGFKTVRGIQKGEEGASLASFFGHTKNSLGDIKNSAAKFAKNPLLTMKGWIKSLISLPKKLMLGADFLGESILLRGAVSTSNFKVIFQVIGKGYSWFGKKLDAPGAHRLSRGLDFMDGLQKTGKLKKIPLTEAREGLRIAREAISDPTLFKQIDSFGLLDNGADMQRAHMKILADDIFTKKGYLNKNPSKISGTLGELSQVGHVVAPDGSSITTIAPGICKQIKAINKCNVNYDVDLIRIKKNPNGEIIGTEILDYKTYSSEKDLRNEFAQKILDRDQSIHGYQKQKFDDNFLPDTPDNRDTYVEFMKEATGMNGEDASQLYDYHRDWVNGLHDNVEVKYEAILHDGKGRFKQPKYLELSSTERVLFPKETKDLMRERFFGPDASCAKCKKMTPTQQDAFIEDLFNAEYNRQPVTVTEDGFSRYGLNWDDINSGISPTPKEPISELMNKLYPPAPPVKQFSGAAEEAVTEEITPLAKIVAGASLSLIGLFAVGFLMRRKFVH